MKLFMFPDEKLTICKANEDKKCSGLVCVYIFLGKIPHHTHL